MQVWFIHQNMPGQFRDLAASLAMAGHRVRFIGQHVRHELPGVITTVYQPPDAEPGLPAFLANGTAVARELVALRQGGERPDLVVAHPGWGEALYVKDILPRVPLLAYGETWFAPHGPMDGFDPDFPMTLERLANRRGATLHLGQSLLCADWILTPTRWQRNLHPAVLHPRMSVIHEGIDTATFRPDPDATFALPDGRVLDRRTPVVTYVARNLEPARGFHRLVPALARLCARRPDVQMVVVGGDGYSYSPPPPAGTSWRDHLLAGQTLDRDRVHLVGRLPYGAYRRLLQVSAAHVYLTWPFVLSWSLLEAMACGCAVVASDCGPVQEVIADGNNGLLTPFHDPEALAEQVCRLLDDRDLATALGAAARQTVVASYDQATRCGPARQALIADLAAGRRPDPGGTP